MHTRSDVIAGLIDRVADLDDAPDRARHEFFYADLAHIAEEICAEAYDDGYTAALRDVAQQGTTTSRDHRPRHRVSRRDSHDHEIRGGIG